MVRCIYIIVFFMLSLNGYTQVSTLGDSIPFLNTDRVSSLSKINHRTSADSFYFFRQADVYKNILFQHPVLFALDTSKRMAHVSLTYEKEKGGYKLPTVAYHTQRAGFYTEGVETLGKIKVQGQFYFYRTWADSLANNLTSTHETYRPYQYFTPKAGSYEGQHYVMGAQASYNMHQHWHIGLGTRYGYEYMAGTVDPRSDVKKFAGSLIPSITYTTNKITTGLYASLGKEDETINIVYKSKVFSLSNMYPERFYYLNYGYGYIGLKDFKVSSSSARGKEIGGAVSYKQNHLLLFSALSYKNNFVRLQPKIESANSATASDFRAAINMNEYKWNTLIQSKSSLAQRQLGINAVYNNIKDYNNLFNGINFTYSNKRFATSYLHLFTNNAKTQWEPGLAVSYSSVEKSDALAAHQLIVKNTTVNTFLNLYMMNSRSKMRISHTACFYIPVSSSLSYPATQKNKFTELIAIQEEKFYAAKSLNNYLEFQWVSLHSRLGKNHPYIKVSIAQDVAQHYMPRYTANLSVGILL